MSWCQKITFRGVGPILNLIDAFLNFIEMSEKFDDFLSKQQEIACVGYSTWVRKSRKHILK